MSREHIASASSSLLPILLVTVLWSVGCGHTGKADCNIGSEWCDCTTGGACNPGLVCVDGVCVPEGSDTSTDSVHDPSMDVIADDGGSSDVPPDGEVVAGEFPSCEGMVGDECGGESCCTTIVVPGGWFAMGRGQGAPCLSTPTDGGTCMTTHRTCLSSGTTWGCPEGTWINLGGDDQASVTEGDDELPEHSARVSPFALDKYEVTVGRIRNFLATYNRTRLLELIDDGAGEHPLISGSGWDYTWDERLPDGRPQFESWLNCSLSPTWTDTVGDNETFPINCLDWYMAYGFCAWDGGRLPTEAEWEFVAVGGDENRLYPWGDAIPSSTLANFLDTDFTPYLDVFAKPAGEGRWGHIAMGGSMMEWTLDIHGADWYGTGGLNCIDCANVSIYLNEDHLIRGGGWNISAGELRSAGRLPLNDTERVLAGGLRCARDL